MKKLTMLAVAVMCGTSAFAQDVYKQLSKIKDYNDILTNEHRVLEIIKQEMQAVGCFHNFAAHFHYR